MVSWNRAMINQYILTQLLEFPTKLCTLVNENFDRSPKPPKYPVQKCRNPSLELTTKARACRNVGQEGNPGVTFHAPGSAKECEGMNPHTPKGTPTLGVGVPVDFEFSKNDCRGQNSLDWSVHYIIEKLLERRCLKWACMTHLHTWNISYGQKKSRESNWQFDSWALKVGNRLDFLACRWCATYHWK